MNESYLGRGLRRVGVAAAAIVALSIASQQRAEALSPMTPGAVPAAKHASDAITTQARHGPGGGGGFHGGGGFRGGGGFHGGGFRGGGFHGGGMHGGGFRGFHGGGFRGFHGGGVRIAPAFHGGFRHGGFHRHYGGYHRFYGGGYRYAYRPHFRRHYHHRRFFYTPSYYYPAYYHHRRCRVIWTYYGPRRICRPWYRHHYYRPYGYW
ncbi:hypothetical protein J6500_16525 [Bradyrhizobium sp. WSM 1704]|uniref:hypothetical protein n=1 Tax=Bradyrhizobium semiaridum TaxID=2821404 RepID=UPI001CE358CF|nr:hypothetical protein [Bradyrhizobium semiaridum]MCA6123489.1 hypothetical protein [Bradyrhizobium semiaridum]